MRTRAFLLLLALVVLCLAEPPWAHNDEFVPPPLDGITTTAESLCIGGSAGGFPCRNVDLLAHLPHTAVGAGFGNDMWGWTDPETGREYAIMGFEDAVAFVDIGDPTQPVHLGNLPTETRSSIWNDLKVYRNHVYIVSEARNHGLQIFDLAQLRTVEDPPLTFSPSATYEGFGSAHNIAINEETGFAYVLGSNTCFGGPHMLDLKQPLAPEFAGCDRSAGYTHDSHCVIYHGPDLAHRGKEICVHANLSPNRLVITDLSDRASPRHLWLGAYPGASYTHQGWLTDDHTYFLLSDEEDEQNLGHNTRTYVWDLRDLDAPELMGYYEAGSPAIDHNLYVAGEHVFQANYRAGLRVLRMGNLENAELAEVAYFDTYPRNDFPDFSGAWSVYPFFASGVVALSDSRGLFLLRPDLAAVAHCEDGIDNDADGDVDLADAGCSASSEASERADCENGADDDGDGLSDHPADPGCASPADDSEQAPELACDDGLDNDEDGQVDLGDPDCEDPSDPSENTCGDGRLEPGESCDDGNQIAGDCCSPLCVFDPPGRACDDLDVCTLTDICDGAGSCTGTEPRSCDDGSFCNGAERCDAQQGCQAGIAPTTDDGIACTLDRCDEELDTIEHLPEHERCDDGAFCNGAESCSPAVGCLAGLPPAVDDGIACTVDACDEESDSLLHLADHVACDDGLFCNGVELCSPAVGCLAGLPPAVDDGIACTADFCDEQADRILHFAEHFRCQDGAFCNGAETCSATEGCLPGAAPVLDDALACTSDRCDEEADQVVHEPDDALCDDGNVCTASSCDLLGGCLHLPIADCAQLRVESATGPEQLDLGEPVSVAAQVGNLASAGPESGPVDVTFYLSRDTQIEPLDDLVVGACRIDAIAMGESEQCEDAAVVVVQEVSLAAGGSGAQRYWGACAQLDAQEASPDCAVGNTVRVPEPHPALLGAVALGVLALGRRRQRVRPSAGVENAVTPTIDRPVGD